ncbi:MAG: Pyruvate:ferredoxin oxidoreductase or related 2-oxoacid:ferredoxin oxidoreductase [Thermodesulfobacterium sp.]|uniref:Pyruvate:ferredoxin oxidoreductase or related 2-oxoacid:ferredoxin oxidoreductase n=1 Tax=Candidatus Thermodesulfobacterium syntrophicum TaxID=3060442 RepID=A0AAE3TFT8_9BACT|nr:Pyruvate:ferredoxin oxidoreductase or related 2-oxoacid:ferredoxin oxidoreductase [Candidatus Thermodesulfobacterium syntrophicum]
MGKVIAKEVSIAIAEAVAQCKVDVISAYPITPQTHIVEHLAELVNNGELDAEYMPVESEHAAMSACIGASATGARTFTSTAAQGLLLMYENLFIASAFRLPIVMVIANRSISAPISIWNDHSDVMTMRDSGWIQTFAENGQEAVDLIYHAYRVAEKALLPVALNIDGFTLSHVIEPIELLDQELVDKYIPPLRMKYKLDPKKPITMGAIGIPEIYTEAKKAQDEALKASYRIIVNAWKEFEKLTGRKYQPIESYEMEDAEVALIIMGSLAGTAMDAVDLLREKGKKVGLIKIRLWRPFPLKDFLKAIGKVRAIGVIDRAVSHGSTGGPVGIEVRSALYQSNKRPKVVNFIAGLSGRDVTVEDFVELFERTYDVISKKPRFSYEIYGVKE